MMETTFNQLAADRKVTAKTEKPARESEYGFYGYWFLFAALYIGWLLRNEGLIDPSEGVGYWMGIVGGSLMLVLLIYPAGKRSGILRHLGLTRHWFRIHMILGLVGPLLILYHCNFQYEAVNSKIALYCMLAVAGSGIVGRYFYARIHEGLYGKRASLEALRAQMTDALENKRGVATIFPKLTEELHLLSADVQGDQITQSIGIGRSFAWTVKHHFVRLRLRFLIRRELTACASESRVLRAETRRLRRSANSYASHVVGLMRRTAQLSFFERLFSLWHVFHMPVFFLLVVSALVHVLAVHMF